MNKQSKKKYIKPILQNHGRIRNITAGGTAGSAEMGMRACNPAKMKMRKC